MKKIMLLPMLFLFSMWSYGQYCIPTAGTSTVEPITLVSFAGIHNVTSPATSEPGYEDYTAMVANVNVGDSPTITLEGFTGGNFTCRFTVFIDWNQNGLLDDAGEMYEIGSIYGSTGTDGIYVSGPIAVPLTALGGNTRMRVIKNYNTSPTNPCGSYAFGQAEDYTVNVTLPSCVVPSNLTATIASMTAADISWDASTSAPSSGYEYAVTTSATPPASGTATTGTSVQGVAISQSVENYLHVRANCGGGDLSSWATYMFMGPTPGQIGYLEDTGALPINSCYAYNYSQQLFYANEVALAGNGNNFITKIRYYYDSAPGSGTANWDNWTVYMAHTSKTEFASASDWVSGTDLIEVFSGNITIPAAGNWMEIELDNGFLWDGISNLVIAIDENVSGYNCTAQFGVFNDPSEVGRTLLHYSDSVNADPLSPPTANGWYYTVNALQLEATPPPSCLKPTQLAVTATTATTADVSWTVGDTETNWNISWGTPGYTPGDSNEINTGTTSGTPDFQITNLTPLTSYDVYVQADCGSGDLSVWEGPFNFTTAADCSIYTLSITANGDYVCDEGTATLTATASGGGEDIYWYDAAVGGNLLGIGNSFETPELTQTTSYWVAEVLNGGPLAGQANANPTTFSNSTSNSGGLLFTVNNPIVIVDVEVFGTSTTGGDITIELRDIDNGNATIASTTATITGGGTAASPIPHTIPLDFVVPAAGNYRLVRTAATASVGMGYVTAANSSFPYPLGNSGEVTGGATATGTSTWQYFFFNWTIKEAALCESSREEAVATVVTVEEVEASATTTQVDPGNSTTLTATSTNTNYTYAWTWDSTTGGGTGTDTGANITVTPSAHTTYTVTATDSVTGCIAIDEIQIVVFNAALCNTLDITTTTGGYICDEGTVTLTATASGSGDDIYWYDAAVGGNLVGKGANFETPELTQTTSYWAAEVLQDIDVPSNTLPTYCTPTFTTGCTSSDTIDDFILEDSTNAVLISHLGTGCSPAGYGDYTGDVSLQADLEAGETYSFSATHGTGSQYVRIWIDFDGNGSFEDAGELVYEATSAASSTVPTVGTFEIPSTISAINTVMRVKTTYSTGASNSCTQSGNWGEAHDYMVSISSVLNLCESPREEAIATVVTVEEVEASASVTQVIPGNSTTLTANSANANYTYVWTWDSTPSSPAGSDTGASITVSPLEHTTYTVTATDSVTGCIATDEIEILVFDTTLCNTLDIATTTDGFACEGSTATLSVTASGTGDNIYWYDAATGGNLVGKGASFETPFLTQTTSYWAAEVLEEGGLTSGQGKPTYSSATSGNSTSGSNWGLIFDAYEAFTIQDVEVYSTGGGGDITIQLQDNTGAMIDEVTVTLPGGGSPTSPVAYTAVLNMDVPGAGTYRLVRTASNPTTVNMIRESSSNTYPYPLGTVGSITSGYLSGTSSTYYWFYNWTVSTAFALCESDREEVIATVISDDAPVGDEYQAFLGNETLADLNVVGANLTWYADAAGVNMLPDTTPLADGATYYVSQSVNGCESEFLAVTTIKGYVYLDNNWLPSNPSGVSTSSDNIYVIDGLTTINVPLDAQDIHVMNDGTLRIENVLHLHGDLTVDGELIFGSTPSGNGELAAVSATSTITGEVTVEHYMKDRRSYRMVSSAVTTTTSIHDNWQEGATSRSDNPNPGYGTHITGTTIDQTNGFDETQTGNASMFTIDVSSQTFQAIANTDVNTLTAGDAYLMFIRGDRTLSNIDTPDGHTATTLRARGQLVTGNHTQLFSTTVAGQFVMFGNPYQSAVDINDVFANSTNVNTNQYYVYDVNIGDYGNYVTVNLPAGTNPSGSSANQYLQAGQAAQFATLSNGPTALNFMESAKAPGNYTSNNASANGLMSGDILNIQLYTAKNFSEGGSVHDGMAILFDAQYSNSITATDAPKAFGFGENIARDHNGTYLSIERREMPVAGEVYSLYTAGYNHQEYVFKIDLEGVTDVMLYLDDNYTGTSTLLQVGVNTYSFEVSDALSQASDRFSIRTESLLNVDDPTSFAGVRLYPNPLNAETFYVHAPMLNGKEIEIRIADISGRQIYNRTLQSTSDRIEVSVNDTLSSGVYLVTIKHAGEFKTYRLIRE